jgi:transcriptional antiterminator RfaH
MDFSKSHGSARDIWIAVNAQPNREQLAAIHLRNQGYEPYMPALRKQIRHARQVRDVLRPLFPGYLFVRLPTEQMRWRPILSTIGVRSVVCSGDAPCVVPGSFIDDLKSREKDGVISRSVVSRQIGDTVRVARGASVDARHERRSARAAHAKFPQCFNAARATPRSEKRAFSVKNSAR